MRKSYMHFLIVSTIILISSLGIGEVHAGPTFGGGGTPTTPYCENTLDCSIDKGQESVKTTLAGSGIKTDKGIADYAQEIVKYLMGFVSVIGVIYIIYAGFQLMTGAGDEEKMKKTRQIIIYVILGIVIMWLAVPIIKWTTKLVTYNEGGLVPIAIGAEYTENDNDTFAEYRNKIREGVTQLEGELMLKAVSTTTIQNLKNLVQQGFDRLPDSGDAGSINREAKQFVDIYLDIANQKPTSSTDVSNAISRVSSFLNKVSIGRIAGSINAGPPEGNAPLAVSFRGDQIKDPSGTTPPDNNYIWWMRENGGVRRELGRGPSLSYTFTKEGIYTVFLDVVSGSRNSKGKIDVLPLSISKQINVKPKLGEVILLINGVNVSNMDKIKISPAIAKMGIILDASASRAIANGVIAETKWDFGNRESSVHKGAPVVERQIYATEGGYILKLSMKTNDGLTFTKEIQLLVVDPVATINLDRVTGHIGEDISMSATSFFSDSKNVEYSWKIQDESGNKVVKSGDGGNFKHKFETVGTYIISLTSKNPNGGIDQDSKTITIESREPVVTIDTPRPIKTERPNTIVFDSSKSYDPDTNSRKNLTYTWKIDGQPVTLDNIEIDGARGTYTFDNKGSHKVSVTVANVYGKITTSETQFEVTSTLTVNIIMTPKVVKKGENVTLIGQSNNAEYFEWNMGDGSPIVSGTNKAIQYAYKQSGAYDVKLNVNRDGGTETNSITRKIYVTDADSPFALISATNTSNSIIEEEGLCDNKKALIVNRAETTTFNGANSVNVDGTTTGLSYTWKYFGKANTTQSVSEKFNELGCFPIELTVRSNKTGASHTSIQYIKLTNRPPEITSVTTSLDNAKKDSQKILVKVKANGAIDPDGVITSYTWYFKTDSEQEPQNVQITQKNEITFVLPNITEKYYFGVIIEDNDGAKVNSIEAGKSTSPLIIDNSNGNVNLPLITLTVPKNVINVGEKIRFAVDVKTIIPGVNITNKSEYAWDFDGDGRIDKKSTVPNIEHVYTRSGDFNMKVRVTNNGVSNSKYQTIHVKNKLKANINGYRLPDGRIYLMNTSEGSYNSAHWEIGSITSESLSSVLLDPSSNPTTGKLTISSNENEVSSTDIDFSKLETITGSGVLYQSFPQSTNDTITVKNPSDKIFISMLGNDATNYAVDIDTLIDSDLDGTPDNDSDNKEDSSYMDGSIYNIYNIDSDHKREHKLRLALIKNGIVVSTRNITIVLDYINDIIEDCKDLTGNCKDLTGSGVSLSVGDKAKLEELSKMIRELTNSDRIILMQRYNTLSENWNNPFDKAKSLIDIQEGIESGSMDNEKKVKMSKIIDDILIGDAQATGVVDIAIILIKDLIPKESPNQEALLAKLAEIESHPASLDVNKKLGKEMLVLIENDSTIPDKYKGHIKTQLLVIINGGADVIIPPPELKPPMPPDTGGGGFLGFIGGFVKIFIIIIGIVFFIGGIAFIFYRLTRKGDTIGFQDFLIDSVFHHEKTTPVADTIIKSNTVVEGPPPLPKEDPLSNYTPPTPPKIVEPIVDNPVLVPQVNTVPDSLVINTPPPVIVASTPEPEHIPDWLKVPSAPVSEINNIKVPNNTPLTETVSTPTVDPIITIEPTIVANSLDNTPEGLIIEPSVEKSEEIATIPEEKIKEISTVEADTIPDWIKNPISTKKEENNTIKSEPPIPIKVPIQVESTNSKEERLPDWLISSLQKDQEPILEISKTPDPIIETPKIADSDNPFTNILAGNLSEEETKGETNASELLGPIESELLGPIESEILGPIESEVIKKEPLKKVTKKTKVMSEKKGITGATSTPDNIPDWLK